MKKYMVEVAGRVTAGGSSYKHTRYVSNKQELRNVVEEYWKGEWTRGREIHVWGLRAVINPKDKVGLFLALGKIKGAAHV